MKCSKISYLFHAFEIFLSVKHLSGTDTNLYNMPLNTVILILVSVFSIYKHSFCYSNVMAFKTLNNSLFQEPVGLWFARCY